MKQAKQVVAFLSNVMAVVAGVTLLVIMLLTVLDVILRYFGRPITGIYDLVALGGAVIVGFSIPYAARKKVHVFMEMAQMFQSKMVEKVLLLLARFLALTISVVVGWNLILLGTGFMKTGEASLTIQIAFYPVAIGLGICFFIQTLVFIVDICDLVTGAENAGGETLGAENFGGEK
jgi:TRAP-type C4-dicarboxylate transport system permease small subunit